MEEEIEVVGVSAPNRMGGDNLRIPGLLAEDTLYKKSKADHPVQNKILDFDDEFLEGLNGDGPREGESRMGISEKKD
jgi:hypothetical protein